MSDGINDELRRKEIEQETLETLREMIPSVMAQYQLNKEEGEIELAGGAIGAGLTLWLGSYDPTGQRRGELFKHIEYMIQGFLIEFEDTNDG